MPTQNNFRGRVRQEVETILIHGIVVLVLETTLLIIGGFVWILQTAFPKEEYNFSLIEKADIWTVFALFCLFAVYTVVRVCIRLVHGIQKEWLTEKEF